MTSTLAVGSFGSSTRARRYDFRNEWNEIVRILDTYSIGNTDTNNSGGVVGLVATANVVRRGESEQLAHSALQGAARNYAASEHYADRVDRQGCRAREDCRRAAARVHHEGGELEPELKARGHLAAQQQGRGALLILYSPSIHSLGILATMGSNPKAAVALRCHHCDLLQEMATCTLIRRAETGSSGLSSVLTTPSRLVRSIFGTGRPKRSSSGERTSTTTVRTTHSETSTSTVGASGSPANGEGDVQVCEHLFLLPQLFSYLYLLLLTV